MPATWTTADAAHLYRRAGFGATRRQLEKSVKSGFEKTLEALLKTGKPGFKPPKSAESLAAVQAWWVRRMVGTKTPLADRLTLFWHNHFATAFSKVPSIWLMTDHMATLRKHATGHFADMLLAVSRDPAMIIWLDNVSNHAGSINENFARELQELFTTGLVDAHGEPTYTETDVREVARAFTGWTIGPGGFVFHPPLHDFGIKTVKGVTGALNGTDVLAILTTDPSTARHISWKLWCHFAFPIERTDPLCDELQGVFTGCGGHIGTLMEFIFRHDAFWSESARRALVKSPTQFLVGSLRLLEAKLPNGGSPELGAALTALGQSLLDPPSVFGWAEGPSWVETSGLLSRSTRGAWIADARGKGHPVKYSPAKLLGKKSGWLTSDAPAVVAQVLDALDTDAAPSTVAALEAYVLAGAGNGLQAVVVDNDFVDLKVRGLVALILSMPEYQLA